MPHATRVFQALKRDPTGREAWVASPELVPNPDFVCFTGVVHKIWRHYDDLYETIGNAPQGRKNSAQVQFIHSKWPFRRTKMIHVWSILKSPKAQQTKNKSWAFLELGFLRPTHFQIQKAQQLGAKSPMENLCWQDITGVFWSAVSRQLWVPPEFDHGKMFLNI